MRYILLYINTWYQVPGTMVREYRVDTAKGFRHLRLAILRFLRAGSIGQCTNASIRKPAALAARGSIDSWILCLYSSSFLGFFLIYQVPGSIRFDRVLHVQVPGSIRFDRVLHVWYYYSTAVCHCLGSVLAYSYALELRRLSLRPQTSEIFYTVHRYVPWEREINSHPEYEWSRCLQLHL